MNWLQQLSGIQWRDVEHEREQTLRSVVQRAGFAFLVRMSYRANNGTSLSSDYLALPIDDNDNTNLYFFERNVKPKNLVGILPVTRIWSPNDCVSDAEILYGECHAQACDIQAIVRPTFTYRVVAGKSASNNAASGQDTCLLLKKQKAEWLKRFSQTKSQ